MKTFRYFLPMMVLLICFTACKKDKSDYQETLSELYKTYSNGEIMECKLDGKTVFEAGINAYDAGWVIYDQDGKVIGECNYAWAGVDSICNELTACETVYRCRDHISGQAYTDKYGLD
ncbi:MAG: hypothetical protein ABIJ16_08770 [Bacteroidota bacterium]